MKDPFAPEVSVHEDVIEAMDWMTALSSEDVKAGREESLQVCSMFVRVLDTGSAFPLCQILEKHAHKLWTHGNVVRWFRDSDALVQGVSRTVNGPLLEDLIDTTEHKDTECANIFRRGAPILGALPCSGIGEPAACVQAPAELDAECTQHNAELLASIREDPMQDELMR